MKQLLPLGAVASILFAGLAPADDRPVEFHIDSDAPDGNVSISSSNLGFDPAGLQVGENRAFTDDDGRSVLVTRNETSLTFTVDGRVIDVPLPPAAPMPPDAGVVELETDVDANVFVSGSTSTVIVRADDVDTDSIHIVSPVEIDDATKASIRMLLESSGYESDVEFVTAGGQKFVHRIKKRRIEP